MFEAGPGLVIDLAADFRVERPPALYERFYGAAPAPELVPRFTYGLADVRGAELRGATAHRRARVLRHRGAARALSAGAGSASMRRRRSSASPGSSGAGVQPKPTTHHPARAHNVFAYSVLGHRHEAEVLQRWREWTGRARRARPG